MVTVSSTPAVRAHPRVRGEHLLVADGPITTEGSSPRPRGARPSPTSGAGFVGLIPASAGSTTPSRRTSRPSRAHPRVRGEHDLLDLDREPGEGSSPRPRGARCRAHRVRRLRGLIPASAGSTRPKRSITTGLRAHPRVRGEHSVSLNVAAGQGGSSPRPRGAPHAGPDARTEPGLIPASAGSTIPRKSAAVATGAHPRVRGEHVITAGLAQANTGSSPRPRGALLYSALLTEPPGLIPASAGSTEHLRSRAPRIRAHPRVRGEHIGVTTAPWNKSGSSPRPRGAPRREAAHVVDLGLIPASAGSTYAEPTARGRRWAHPRVRGEHQSYVDMATRSAGSSPRPRGALHALDEHIPREGLIPASAGSTWAVSGVPPKKWTRLA